MRAISFIYLFLSLSDLVISQTFCALISYPDFSNGYHCPQAYVDENLKVLYKEDKDMVVGERIFVYKDGLGRIRRNRKFGFINHKGNIIIPDTFDKAEDFSEGYAAVEIKGKWGFINTKGELAVKPIYKSVKRFSCGLAAVEINGKRGYIDPKGTIVIPLIYDDARYFKDDKAWVLLKGKWGYINKNGKFIIQPGFKEAYDFSEGYCWVKVGMLWGLIDSTTKIIIPFSDQNHQIYSASGAKKILSDVKYGLIVTKEKGKTGFSTIAGLKKIIPSKFNEVLPFEDSLAIAYIEGKCGIIRPDGNFFIEPNYEEIRYLGHKNIFAIRKNKNWSLLYKDSGKISPEEFENIHNFEMIR